MSRDIEDVLAANQSFYDAFAARDMEAMARLWSSSAEIACVHPGWDALDGREAVLTSWRDILAHPGGPRIRCANARAYVMGEAAFVVCHEILGQGMLVATNGFVREAGGWRMVHHHAGAMAPVAETPPGRLH